MAEQEQERALAEAVSALFAERSGQMVGYARKRLCAAGVPQSWVDPEDALASVLARVEPIERLRPYVFRVIRNEVWHATQRYRTGRAYGHLDADDRLGRAHAKGVPSRVID
ncbi:hypothetical protein [Streptomyces luteogriseus]|uniref:hypothetical protein n=1 Tax=Streptomyces luteogriseus TaxID=68233 RepID=UPI0037A8D012